MMKKALIFESDDGMSRALVPALALFGDTEVLDIARTPSSALQLLAKHRHAWDVVVVDLSSVVHMGMTLLQACDRRLAHQRVLVLAKDDSEQVRAQCAALGADCVFGKDTEMDDFFSACKRSGPAASQAEAPRANA